MFNLWRAPLTLAIFLLAVTHTTVAAELLRQEHPIADVRKVSVSSAVHLTVRQGATESLFIEAAQTDMNRVQVRQRGHHLELGADLGTPRFLFWLDRGRERDPIHFILEVRDLERLVVSGAVEATISELDAASFHLEVSGASKVTIDFLSAEATRIELSGTSRVAIDRLDSRTLDADVSGASRLEVSSGEPMAVLIARASGASHIDTMAVTTGEANVDVSAASRAYVRVQDQLNVTASAASQVEYAGNPRVQQNISGASSIRAQR
ncbi:DUF2807 domain-containing protein [Salinispirillum sp. LH 10-3-1]|uniref:DUF2807 domain-containing protein n=1 Tax=Salinispirillum sp. LH 10-3-1 TaxID=2952525 RepID=A0AB38YH63_9GAMM